jgi:hypothetical protein
VTYQLPIKWSVSWQPKSVHLDRRHFSSTAGHSQIKIQLVTNGDTFEQIGLVPCRSTSAEEYRKNLAPIARDIGKFAGVPTYHK